MAALWWVLGAGSVGAFLLALAIILVLGFRGGKLPPGIVRAVLAIVLVGIFVVVIIGGVVLAAQGTTLSDDNKQFYLSVVAPLGTLAAAAAAFYFGTKSVQAAGAAMASRPTGPSLGVTNTEPRGAKTGTVPKITVHGSGFDEDTRFFLRRVDDGKEIAAKEATIHSSQVATAQFDLAGATPGSCHLVATGPAGERVSLRHWFTIEE
jgi:hypothetical protein